MIQLFTLAECAGYGPVSNDTRSVSEVQMIQSRTSGKVFRLENVDYTNYRLEAIPRQLQGTFVANHHEKFPSGSRSTHTA
jgi:hypothetical protein